jgi:hypothetical protein
LIDKLTFFLFRAMVALVWNKYNKVLDVWSKVQIMGIEQTSCIKVG